MSSHSWSTTSTLEPSKPELVARYCQVPNFSSNWQSSLRESWWSVSTTKQSKKLKSVSCGIPMNRTRWTYGRSKLRVVRSKHSASRPSQTPGDWLLGLWCISQKFRRTGWWSKHGDVEINLNRHEEILCLLRPKERSWKARDSQSTRPVVAEEVHLSHWWRKASTPHAWLVGAMRVRKHQRLVGWCTKGSCSVPQRWMAATLVWTPHSSGWFSWSEPWVWWFQVRDLQKLLNDTGREETRMDALDFAKFN